LGIFSDRVSEIKSGSEVVFSQDVSLFPDSAIFEVSLSRPLTKEGFEQEMRQKAIVTMASGGTGGQFKFFLYAQHAETNLWFLVEARLSQGTNSGSVTIKAGFMDDAPGDSNSISHYAQLFTALFKDGI